MSIKIQKINTKDIDEKKKVKVIESGNIIDIKQCEKRNLRQNGKLLNANEYLVFSTGEILPCKHTKTRQESIKTLKHSIEHLRNIINANFDGQGKESELWITLTFGKNKVYLAKNLYGIFKSFMMRLRYYLEAEQGKHIEYICVPEPHEKGDWHIHLLLKEREGKDLYIPKKILMAIWQQGFVKVNDLKQVDNVGAYLSAYLTNMKTKKGARLYLYPANHNLYRKSKGIKKPKEYFTSYEKAKEKVKDKTLTYSSSFEIELDNGFTNTITHYQYKR